MPRKTVARTRAVAIHDGIRIVKASKKHWTKLVKKGAKPESLKTLEATIAEAKTMEVSDRTLSMEELRRKYADGLGAFRIAADLVARPFEGIDTKAVKALKLDIPFPDTDAKLVSHLDGLKPAIGSYSEPLAEHDFGKKAQDGLLADGAAFAVALTARPDEASAHKATNVDRDAVFERLRYQTGFFRRLGRAALRNSKERADFDRVRIRTAPKRKKKSAPPAAAAKSAKDDKTTKDE